MIKKSLDGRGELGLVWVQTDRSVIVAKTVLTKGEETRERILARAAALFNKKGFAGASLSDIMEATGLQKGGLYNHFESKEALAVEAFEYAISKVSDRIKEAVAQETTNHGRLVATLRFFREYGANPPVAGGCPILNTAVESDDTNPVLRARARAALDQLRNAIRRHISRGMAAGEFKETVDAERTTNLYLSAVEGAIMMSKLYGDPDHLRRVVDDLLERVERELRR